MPILKSGARVSVPICKHNVLTISGQMAQITFCKQRSSEMQKKKFPFICPVHGLRLIENALQRSRKNVANQWSPWRGDSTIPATLNEAFQALGQVNSTALAGEAPT